MALWMVRAGKYGEQEAAILENNVIAIGWKELGDLSKIKSSKELEELFKQTWPKNNPNAIANKVGQIWAFKTRIQVDDWVVVPLKTRSAVAVGIVQSEYKWREDLRDTVRHTRRVKWLTTDLPRTRFDPDLQHSFGALMTVCQVRRNDAENRVRAIVQGKPVPASSTESKGEADVGIVDLAQLARDQIQVHISRKFRGHKLAYLVDAILKAQGFVTKVSPEGPDRGVDILAASGHMGFDPPRMCVQVKSSDSPVDVGVLRELRGTMKAHNADYGLLVSWGGFKPTVFKEAATAHFEIRLWDAGELLNQMLVSYERLSESFQAQLPLKRIWTLALEEESE